MSESVLPYGSKSAPESSPLNSEMETTRSKRYSWETDTQTAHYFFGLPPTSMLAPLYPVLELNRPDSGSQTSAAEIPTERFSFLLPARINSPTSSFSAQPMMKESGSATHKRPSLDEEIKNSVDTLVSLASEQIRQPIRNGEVAALESKLNNDVELMRRVLRSASERGGVGAKLSEHALVARSEDGKGPAIFKLHESIVELTNTNDDEWLYFDIAEPTRADRNSFFTCMYRLPESELSSMKPDSTRMERLENPNSTPQWVPAVEPYRSFGFIAPKQTISLLLSYVPLYRPPSTAKPQRKFYHLVCIKVRRASKQEAEAGAYKNKPSSSGATSAYSAAKHSHSSSTSSPTSLSTSISELNTPLSSAAAAPPSSTLFIAFMANPESGPEPDANEASSTKGYNPNSHWSIPFGEVYRRNLLGRGTFGTVFHASIRGLHCSLKYWPEVKQDFVIECRALSSFRHQNLIPFIGAYHKAEEKAAFILLKLANQGNLCDYYSKPTYQTDQSFQLAYEIALGLEYLHKAGYIHRDIKSLNVLVDGGSARLIDFGSTRTEDNAKQSTRKTGTMPWVAPEVMAPRPQYTTATDVFSFGLVMYELAACKPPPQRSLSQALAGAVPAIPAEFATKYPDYAALYLRCVQRRPELRPSISDVVVQLWSMQRLAPVQTPSGPAQADDSSLAAIEAKLFAPEPQSTPVPDPNENITFPPPISTPLPSLKPPATLTKSNSDELFAPDVIPPNDTRKITASDSISRPPQ